ncbi:hypothetical protein CcCBS67573_g05849 [Chytriomyces confervae]|uniref:Uncharacterized protein n=1 Tax=Chytriomyces confervae TaxID=246404 RepID=A0A507FAX0_9FUNG|nr:hypothetical protein CcCBS67573_g05849 [Chytriomyces confervae]
MAQQILTAALQTALSPSPHSRHSSNHARQTSTNNNNTGGKYGRLSVSAQSLDASNEEIWVPTPPEQDVRTDARSSKHQKLLQMDADIADDDWANFDAREDDDAYFSYKMGSKGKFRKWIHKNRYLLLMVVATISIAGIVVGILDANTSSRFHSDAATQSSQLDQQPVVILVSLDGFRAEYLSRGLTPNLHALATSGISAAYMKPSFPSLTFPNHYTIVTGLYPESHGIVGNVFRDPKLNDTFVYVDPVKNKDGHWWGGEPLWVTTIKAGLKSGTCMWPGSEAPIKSIVPTYSQAYNGSMPNADRVAKIVSWLSLPAPERPSFMTLYISEVDTLGHKHGPNAPQVNAALTNVDHLVGTLVEGVLKARGVASLQESGVNVVVVSDHGMTEGYSFDKFVFLDDYVPKERFEYINNIVVSIYPKKGEDLMSIYNSLRTASAEHGHWHVWLRDQVPSEYHFRNNDRIGPIVALPDDGYGITLRTEFTTTIANKPYKVGGMHGYNNSITDMRAIFIASGAAFKSSGFMFADPAGGAFKTVGGADLEVDGEGHVVPANAGAAIGGSIGVHGKRGDFEAGIASPATNSSEQVLSRTLSEPLSATKRIESATVTETTSTHTTEYSTGVLPGFNNVEVYNLILHVLRISSFAAPNNGTSEGLALFKPWLNYQR